jgi:hypothetical protein
MGNFAIARAAVLAALVIASGISAAKAQGNLTPTERAGRLMADMQHCAIDKTTADAVTRKLNDWVRHTERNDNALACTRDPKCTGWTVEISMAYLCARVLCDKGPPPAAKPDCAEFVPRIKAMRIMRDDWQPKDGLR